MLTTPLKTIDDDALVPLSVARRDFLAGVTDTTLTRWRQDPEMAFPAVKKIRRRNYVRGADLKAFVAQLHGRAAAA